MFTPAKFISLSNPDDFRWLAEKLNNIEKNYLSQRLQGDLVLDDFIITDHRLMMFLRVWIERMQAHYPKSLKVTCSLASMVLNEVQNNYLGLLEVYEIPKLVGWVSFQKSNADFCLYQAIVGKMGRGIESKLACNAAVSYTHLTLPTIYSV